MTLRARRLVFEGHLEAHGFVFTDDAKGRARVLRLWRPGASLHRSEAGLTLQLPSPVTTDAAVAPGAPVIAVQGRLVAQPLSPRELSALDANGLWLARHGQTVNALEGAAEVDPSSWLDVSGFSLVPTRALTAPPPPVEVAPSPRPLELKVRLVAAGDGAPALVEALAEAGVLPPAPRWRRAVLAVLRWWGRDTTEAAPSVPLWRRAPTSIRRWLSRADPPPDALTPPRPPNVFQRLATSLDQSAVGRWLARQQQAYVDRLLKLFEQEDLDAALRHAVPLSREAGDPTARAPLSVPGPRANLSLRLSAPARGAPGITLQADRYAQLRAKYRAAAEKLEREGKLDEALFVLVELLEAPLDGIAMLERHGRFRQAAELAEARKLAPELVVRLLVAAKDWPRALAHARRTRSYAAAISLAERAQQHEVAGTLRLAWADGFASAGDFSSAVSTAWGVRGGEPLVRRWVSLGLEAEGPGALRLLVRQLELDPQHPEAPLKRALETLRNDAPDEAPTRAALAESLLNGTSATAEVRSVIARAAVRALIRDEAALGAQVPGLLDKLLRADEGPLRADFPPFVPAVPRVSTGASLVIPGEPSAFEPFAAVSLPGGRTLVALGEVGLALVARDGRVSWRAPVSAHQLVRYEGGEQVLAVSRRDDVLALSRVMLATRSVTRWAELDRVTAFAPTVVEGLWFIAQGAQVSGLETAGERPLALWRHQTRPEPLVALAATTTALVTLRPTTALFLQVATTQLPDFDGLSPTRTFTFGGVARLGSLCSTGHFVVAGVEGDGSPCAWVPQPGAERLLRLPLPGEALAVAATPASCAVATRDERGVRVTTFPSPPEVKGVMQAGQQRLLFEGATRVTLSWEGSVLVCAANTGVVLCFDTVHGTVLRRVTVKAT
jgi:hypothetical protein